MSFSSDFVIKKGILTQYTGFGGDVVIPEGVQKIGFGAFKECERLRSVTLPEGVEEIGRGAFLSCSALSRILLPQSLKKIGENAFCDCRRLASVTLPAGVCIIRREAFAYCNNLKRVMFEGDVKTVGRRIFSDCCKVRIDASEDTFAKIWRAQGVNQAFYVARSLAKGGKLRKQETWFLHRNFEQIYRVSVGIGDASALPKALEICKVLPLEKVEKYLKLTEKLPEFKSVFLDYQSKHYPPEVIEKMKEVEAGKELGLIPRTVSEWKKIFFFEDEGEGVRIRRYRQTAEHVMIPERIGRKRVVKIGSGAFAFNARVRSVEIPEGVTEIGDRAFYHCKSLENVLLPQNLRVIGEYAFYTCEKLERSDVLERVESIGSRAFFGCHAFADGNGLIAVNGILFDCLPICERLSIPAGIREIGEGAFRNFTPFFVGNPPRLKLRSVQIPEGVECIGKEAFKDCVFLEEVKLPKGLRRIGESAFSGCERLNELTLPEALESIGETAFWGCKSLKGLDLPEKTAVGRQAFGRCEGMADENGFVIVNGELYAYTGLGGELRIPEGVKRIRQGIFFNCLSLSVELPQSLEELGDAFYACKGLTKIRLPRGLKRIEKGAFGRCDLLLSVTVSDPETLIEEEAFESENVCLYSSRGSAAEAYAKKHKILWKEI